MDNIPIDVVRLADSSDEPYNKYKKTNEDRLNANFRRLKEVSEQLGESTEQLEDDTSKLLTPKAKTVTNSHCTARFISVGNVKAVYITDPNGLATSTVTTLVPATDMEDFLPLMSYSQDCVAMSSNNEHVRLYIDPTNGVRAYNYSNNTGVINLCETITYI